MKIVAENLSKRFHREWVFRNFNFEFSLGNFYIITGPNGSGKSTLMQVLWGQLPPSTGSLSYSSCAPDDVYKSVSIAAPYLDLIDEFTLEEMVNFHFKFKACKISVEQVIKKINLPSSYQKPIATFSSGMKQRLKLGLAFFSKADVLFLDEPTTNLDKNSIEWYKTQLAEITESIIIMASNQENEYPEAVTKIDILSFK